MQMYIFGMPFEYVTKIKDYTFFGNQLIINKDLK